MTCSLIHGDCLEVLPTLPDDSVDSVVTDPPYNLGFMGKAWDRDTVAFNPATWAAVLRVAKPGAYLCAFGGTRTFHRLACAIEDGGWEIRDTFCWLYGSGFPKGKACVKPAWEPVILARKPGRRVEPLNIDACRIPANGEKLDGGPCYGRVTWPEGWNRPWTQDEKAVEKYAARSRASVQKAERLGRWPSNLLLSHAEGCNGECVPDCPVRLLDESNYADSGGASRFFTRFLYCPKANRRERGEGNNHPTVKPVAVVEWLIKLITPEGGTVLDPFLGSGTTGVACANLKRNFIGIEKEEAYFKIAESRINTPFFAEAGA